MCASVYFNDITTDFIHHYMDLMKEDPKKTDPMYEESEKVQLFVGKEKFEGHTNVCKQIQSMGKFELSEVRKSSFLGQPFGKKGDVIISANVKSGSKEYVSTFVLHETDTESHRFSIVTHILHPL